MTSARKAVALGVALFAGSAWPADGAGSCTTRALIVDGSPVDVTLCTTDVRRARDAAETVDVTVAEEFRSSQGRLIRTSRLQFLAGEQTSRTLEDVPIASIGIPKTLHLTLRYHGGVVTLEHAMLLPGAVPVL